MVPHLIHNSSNTTLGVLTILPNSNYVQNFVALSQTTMKQIRANPNEKQKDNYILINCSST